jgi:hypothetical protein
MAVAASMGMRVDVPAMAVGKRIGHVSLSILSPSARSRPARL